MTTSSTPEQNDPEQDNRAEYTPPPCAVPISGEFDEDGCAIGLEDDVDDEVI